MNTEKKFNKFNKKKLVCRNCGKPNHHIKNCYEPKTSFGIILYKIINRKLNILLIKRRNTLGFVQFIRGQYSLNKPEYIQKLFNVMTNKEIKLIKTSSFKFLWNHLWKDDTPDVVPTTYDYITSLRKFNSLIEGTLIKDRYINLTKFISDRVTNYIDQEWGFPKGRKNKKETNIETALREFTEETGIDSSKIKILNKKFIENYISYDDVEYKNIYFLAKYIGQDNIFNISDNIKEQFTEVSAVDFFDINIAYELIRDYSCKKKEIVKLVKNYINKFL